MATPPAVAAICPISPGPCDGGAPCGGGAPARDGTLDGGGEALRDERTGALGFGLGHSTTSARHFCGLGY